MQVRVVAGVVCGALAASLGALILGEYEFSGMLPYVAGVLFGLVIAEVIVSVAGAKGAMLAAIAAVLSAGGLLWAGWIDSNEGIEPVKPGVWVAVMIGAVAGWLRVAGLPRARR